MPPRPARHPWSPVPARVRVPASHPPASPAGAGRPFCAFCPLDATVLAVHAQSPGCPRLILSRAERIRAGSKVHSGRGIAGRFAGGATAARSSAVAADAWFARRAPARSAGDALGRRLLARRARGSGTHLGAGSAPGSGLLLPPAPSAARARSSSEPPAPAQFREPPPPPPLLLLAK